MKLAQPPCYYVLGSIEHCFVLAWRIVEARGDIEVSSSAQRTQQRGGHVRLGNDKDQELSPRRSQPSGYELLDLLGVTPPVHQGTNSLKLRRHVTHVRFANNSFGCKISAAPVGSVRMQ